MNFDMTPPPPDESVADEPLRPDEGSGEQVRGRRAMRRYRKSDIEIDEEEDDDGEVLVVSLKLRPANRKKVADAEEPESKSKATRPGGKPGPPVDGLASASNGPGTSVVAASPIPDGAPLMKLTPRAYQGDNLGFGERSSEFPWKLVRNLAVVAVAAALAFLVGRERGRRESSVLGTGNGPISARVPKLTTAWSPDMLAQLDGVLAADQKGDLKFAWQLANDLKKAMPDARGLDLYMSTLQVRQGQYEDAEADVSKLIDAYTAPLQAAAVNASLGFGYARHRDLERSIAAFADAASQDPFNADHFQQWAESLRRKGQLQEAIDRFGQALGRLPAGVPSMESQRREIEFKIALSQIELGKDDGVRAAIATHLKDPAPNGYWLLTAAAYSLQHNDLPAAFDALVKARRLLPPDDYAALANDYFFHPFADRKELVGVLPGDSPDERVKPFRARMGHFIDP